VTHPCSHCEDFENPVTPENGISVKYPVDGVEIDLYLQLALAGGDLDGRCCSCGDRGLQAGGAYDATAGILETGSASHRTPRLGEVFLEI
jgi:hypothetical protein